MTSMDEEEQPRPFPSKEDLLQSAREQLDQSKKIPEPTTPDVNGSPPDIARSLHHDVDLSRRALTELPEELIDIIKNEVNRLALHRNNLTGLSSLAPRIKECVNLKYLVLKRNRIKIFPEAVLSLTGLETLDLEENKIEIIPETFPLLRNLRICGLSRNRIKHIPPTLASMRTLQTLDISKNPVEFPPKETWMCESEEDGPKKTRHAEVMDRPKRMEETRKIMIFLKEYIAQQKSKRDVTDSSEQSESNAETPRPKRKLTRPTFLFKTSVSNISLEHMATSRPTSPLPPRPGLSKSYTTIHKPQTIQATRPGIAPITNGNERNRSNSESFMMTTTRRERRRGIMTKDLKLSQDLENGEDLNSIQDRLSHYRGASYASALPNGQSGPVSDVSEQTSPVEGDHIRPSFVHRLSNLPEGKRKSRAQDPLPAFTRTILYSLRQVIIPTVNLIDVLKQNGSRQNISTLERTCARAQDAFEQLKDRVEQMEYEGEHEGESHHIHSNSIPKICEASVKTFMQLCKVLKDNVQLIIERGNRLYIRTLMHLLYASLIEVQNACKKLGNVELQIMRYANGDRLHINQHEASMTASRRPTTSMRIQQEPAYAYANQDRAPFDGRKSMHQPSWSGISRSTSTTSFTPTTPHSTDSFASAYRSTAPTSRSNSNNLSRTGSRYDPRPIDRDEQVFESVRSKLETTCKFTQEILPTCNKLIQEAREAAKEAGNDTIASAYSAAYATSRDLIRVADEMRSRATSVVLDKRTRDSPDFWQQAKDFTGRVFDLMVQLADVIKQSAPGTDHTPLKRHLRRLRRDVQEVTKAINDSPWAPLAGKASQLNDVQVAELAPAAFPPHLNGGHYRNKSSRHHQYHYSRSTQQPVLSLQTQGPIPPPDPDDPQSAVSVASVASNVSSGPAMGSGHATPLPATPMSAALGHAALATVPVPAMTELPDSLNGSYFSSSNGSSSSSVATAIDRSSSVTLKR